MEDISFPRHATTLLSYSFNGFCQAKASVAAAAMSTKGTKKFKNSTGVWEEGVWHGFQSIVFCKNFRDGFLVFQSETSEFHKKSTIFVYISRFSPSRNFPTKDSITLYNMKSPTTKKNQPILAE